jgi:polyribonucleotide nucleotidyltransferase
MIQTHYKDTQVDDEKIDIEQGNLRLHLEVTRQGLLIVDLEEQVQDEKKILQQVCDAKLQAEAFIAFQDAVIEKLEAKVEENNIPSDSYCLILI